MGRSGPERVVPAKPAMIPPAADFELARAGRISPLGCKRWKAAQTSVDPLRALYEARPRL